jgi:hypothetical protein
MRSYLEHAIAAILPWSNVVLAPQRAQAKSSLELITNQDVVRGQRDIKEFSYIQTVIDCEIKW